MPWLPSFGIQQRVLKTLVARCLGRYLLDQELEGLESDLGRGFLSLSNLRLNCDEINALLPAHLPLRVANAALHHVSLTLSSPLSWSSTIQIKASGLEVELDLLADVSPVRTDLEQSFFDTLLGDGEGLQQSVLDLSLVDEPGLPGDFDAVAPSVDLQEERGVLAGVLEGLFQRLMVDAEDIHIKLSTDTYLDFALKATSISLRTSAIDIQPTRHIDVQGLRVDMRTRAELKQPSRKSSSTSGASADDMAMSVAVADLRESASSMHDDEASIYASMLPEEAVFRPVLWIGEQGVHLEAGDAINATVGDVHCALCAADVVPLRDLLDALPKSSPKADTSDSSKTRLSLRLTSVNLRFFYDILTIRASLTTVDDLQRCTDAALRLMCADVRYEQGAAKQLMSCKSLALEEILSVCGEHQVLRILQCPAPADSEDIEPREASAISFSSVARAVEVAPLLLDVDIACIGRLRPILDLLEDQRAEGNSTDASLGIDLEITLARLQTRLHSPFVASQASRPLSIVTIDVHEMATRFSSEHGSSRSVRFDQVEKAGMSLQVHRVSVGVHEAMREGSDAPVLIVRGSPAFAVTASASQARATVGHVIVDIDKSHWDTLQLWADSVSRFMSAQSPAAADLPASASHFAVLLSVEQAKVLLHYETRTFGLQSLGIRLTADIRADAAPAADLRCKAIDFSHTLDHGKLCKVLTTAEVRSYRIWKSKQHLTCSQSDSESIALHLRVSALEGSKKNGNRFKGALHGLTVVYSPDLRWTDDLSAFLKAPVGAFENVVPAERTDIDFVLRDVSIVLQPLHEPVCGIIIVEDGSVATVVRQKAASNRTSLVLSSMRLLLKDSETSSELEISGKDWASQGCVQAGKLEKGRLSFAQQAQKMPAVTVKIIDAQLQFGVCSDTLASLSCLFANLSPVSAEPIAAEPITRQSSAAPPPVNVLPDLSATAADLLAEDLLSESFVIEDASQKAARHVSTSTHATVEENSCRIRCVHKGGLQIVDDYMSSRQRGSKDSVDTEAKMKLTLEKCSLSLQLFSGFDWEHSRAAVRKQVKAVRRRLQQIRQVLADGQTPEETAEEASADLRKSVYLPLPSATGQADAAELLNALSELDSTVEEEDWQELPVAKASKLRPPLQTRPSDFHRSLHRSAQHAVAIQLAGINVAFSSLVAGGPDLSRMMLTAESFEMLDNMSSSTWHKFLTEMRVGDGGVARPTGAPALRVELVTTANSSLQSELSLKIKVVPLRLFVDQDALEFLKTFFAPPVSDTASTPATPAPDEAFLQRVEILPVKIKLDYKPKRVDYQALRRGKTLELMNFFNFEGSEMTLRHIVLSGVRGWLRLSDLLQDIWTPDVKSNQLADFLAGIAPVRSVVNVGGGVADLVLLPLEQYRKDGRFGRGLQRGASSFGRTAAKEALRLGARLATGTQVILEQAEAVIGARFGSHAPISAEVAAEAELVSKYASQPITARQGLASAAESLGGNLRSTAQTIFAVPLEVFERSSADGPVRAVVRATPIGVVFRPAIGVVEAMSKGLAGLSNQLEPGAGLQFADKYKRSSHSPAS